MLARLREWLDVARAIVRRPSGPVPPLTYATPGPADLSFREAIERNPIQPIEMQSPGMWVIAEPALPPGLVPCPTCATMQQPREGHMAVHFASAHDQRPCVGSWPARKVAACSGQCPWAA